VIFCANTISKQYLFNGSNSSMSLLASGFIAGSVNAIIVAPVEMIRTHQILASKDPSAKKSIPQIIRQLTQQYGMLSLWTGLFPTILRDGPGVGLYLLAFDFAKGYIHQSFSPSINSEISLWTRIVAGSFAGIVFWTWAIPVDTVKTLIESSLREKAPSGQFKHILSNISVSQLYRALPLAYMRGMPSAAVTLTTYDVAIEWIMRPKIHH